ncbi:MULTISPECIES: hypothetical protein [Bacillaceae]|uniref:hypothetical protein n=1 Tax=Metabacillus sp. 22489 TaxID=3453928 RepID=UPI000BA6493B|nr:hypothetical protein CHH83_10590 [Bacillus sp. 7586-K]
MGKELHFGKDILTLKVTGLTSFFAFKRKILIPYKMIEEVFVGSFQAPQWMIRAPGTSFAPLNIYEGSFKYRDEWYFLSYARTDSLLKIELNGHEKYNYIIIQIDNPTEIAASIRRHIHLNQEYV